MTTMLRSLRYARRLSAGAAARRLGAPAPLLHRAAAPTSTTTTTSVLGHPSISCSLGCLHQDRNYVTNVAVKREFDSRTNVDEILRELDLKSRKMGYIFKDDLEILLDAVMVKGTLTSTQTLLMIRCCGSFLQRENPKTRQAYLNRVWETAKALNVSLDVSHYNALLLVHLENGTNFSPLEILVEMKNKNISPNRVTFQRLIEQYCLKGDIPGATKVLEHMSQQEIPLNENIFNSLIIGHSVANDVPSALNILNIMKQASIEPTSNTYTAILCVHAKKGDIEAIRSVLQECREKDILISDKELLNVISTLAINKHSEHLDEIMSNLSKGGNYNRFAVQTMCKLIENHEPEAAFKIQKSLVKLASAPEEGRSYDGALFLKKLISNNYDVQEIINYCELTINNDINPSIYEIVLFAAYKDKLYDLAIPLLKAMKKSGREIREHYFYPLFVFNAKTNNLQGILNVMRVMIFDFELPPMVLTVRDYIIPHMVEDPVNNIKTLVNNNLSFTTAANASLIYLLDENKTHQALNLVLNTQMICRRNLLERPFINSFLNTKDVKTLATLLQLQLQTNKNADDKNTDANTDTNVDSTVFVNNVIKNIIKQLPKYDLETTTAILSNLLEKGISIEENTANFIKRHLGENLSSEIEEILSKLTSSDLNVQPLKRVSSFTRINSRSRSVSLKSLEEKADQSLDHKLLLIQEHAKALNHEIVQKLLKEVEEVNPTYTVGFCVSLLECFSKSDKLEDADKWYKKLIEINPESKLDKSKILNYAIALIKGNRVADALKILEHPIQSVDNNRDRLVERLLITASTYCPEQVEELFNKLKQCNYFQNVTTTLISPLIKAQLNLGNVEKALEKFKWACEEHKITPHKNGLMVTLIRSENVKLLQHITDLCTEIYGESNALFDLALAFLECDRPRQARKILETTGFRVKQNRIVHAGQNFTTQQDSKKLEKFIELVSGLQYDLNPLYNMLLDLYGEENDWQKSLALWTQMQEDNIQPSVKFMNKLENILRSNNQKVPFDNTRDTEVNSVIKIFNDALNNGKIEEAKDAFKNIPEDVKSSCMLQIINFYVRENNFTEALEAIKELCEVNRKIVPQLDDTVKVILTKLIDSNDFKSTSELIFNLSKYYRKQKKRSVFPFILNNIYYESGKYEDLFKHLESVCINKENAEKYISNLFHTNTAVKAISKYSELEEKFKSFALKLTEYDVWAPINAIWIHKLVNNSPDAENFYKEHIKKVFSVSAVFALKENKAWDKFPSVTDKIIETSGLNNEEKRKSATMLLVHILNSEAPNKYELAFDCLRKIIQICPLNTINSDLIKRIEENFNDKTAFQVFRTEGERSQKEATG